MLIKVYGSAIFGVAAQTITIEVNIDTGGVGYHLVGLPDNSIRESSYRISAALKNVGYKIPGKKITINMAPADLRKEGAAYDLSIALGILAASDQIVAENIHEYIIMGELSLDGSLQPIKGVLPIAIQAREEGFKGIILPKQNTREAAIVNNLDVYGVENIKEVIDFFNEGKPLQKIEIEDSDESLRNNIQEFHKNFESLIDETKIDKIIVFIDDLDRCSPDTIIGTLEAIKLFLFTKKTAFVIGADERLIKYAVKRRFPELAGENLEIGRDYLEKLIQYPIRIPPLNKIELTTYVNLLFSQLYSVDTDDFELRRNEVIKAKSKNGFDFALDQNNISDFFHIGNKEFEDAITLCSQIVPVLSTGLNGNPRQAKRFLNTLLIRISMASAKGIELKKRVLAKLMLLEYFKPETFTDFHDIQAGNNGAISLIDKLETITFGKENAEPKDISEGDEASSEEKILLEDNWIVEWIQSEPKLGKENLQPYFYFSRDKLTISAVNFQRMTPKAQEIIRRLLGDSEIARKSAIKSLSTLSSSEAASVFEALTEKVKQEENLNDSKAFKALFYLCEEKSDLKSQAITFLTKYPDHKLPLIAITFTDRLLKTSNPEALNHLFNIWSKSANENFAKIVRKKIK